MAAEHLAVEVRAEVHLAVVHMGAVILAVVLTAEILMGIMVQVQVLLVMSKRDFCISCFVSRRGFRFFYCQE